jgi:UTP--glucose-1-phosphate uridylyltransferase
MPRALIPCGGKGTRMLALTGGAPKELLPVGGTSAVARVVQECAAGGFDELLVVIAPDKEVLVEHLSPLQGTPGHPSRIDFVIQPVPRGLADAIRFGRDFAAGEPLGVALPDNLFVDDAPAMRQLHEAWARHGTSVVGVVEITAEEARRRGATSVYEGRLEGDDFHLRRIPDKGEKGGRFDTGGRDSAFTGIGRYVFTTDAFDAIDEVEQRLPAGRELDDIPVMQLLLERRRMVGCRVRGRFLDLGLPEGYVEADALFSARAAQ